MLHKRHDIIENVLISDQFVAKVSASFLNMTSSIT